MTTAEAAVLPGTEVGMLFAGVFRVAYIRMGVYIKPMDLVRIHECLCERTRLRIVHLLLRGPLCVCHLQEALREPQVKMSRHLAYLRRRGLVLRERCGQWMIYRLPDTPPPALAAQLACLQDAAAEEAVFRRDRVRLDKLKTQSGPGVPSCARPARVPSRRAVSATL